MAKKIAKPKKQLQQENSQNQDLQEKSFTEPGQEDIDKENDEIKVKEPENQEIPFQQYRKSFSVFNRKSRSQQFKSYAKLKSEQIFDKFKKAFEKASGLSFEADKNEQKIISNKLPTIPQQNIFTCKSPSDATIFIHVYKADEKRCHIRVMNASGYVYAYFVDIKPIRKFPKIYKIMQKIGNQNLFMILDQFHDIEKQQNHVLKIADYAEQFCYHCHLEINYQSLNSQFANFLEKTVNNNHKRNILTQENLYCFYSNIFKSNKETLLETIKKMIKIQHDIESPSDFPFEQSDDSMDFLIKSILINYHKFNRFSDIGQMYVSFKNIIDGYEDKFKNKEEVQYGDPEDHYPQKMETCKECVYCPILSKKRGRFAERKTKKSSKQGSKSQKKDADDLSLKVRKSKYRCEGCSAIVKKDVPICLECFRDYHVEKEKRKMRNMKKSKNYALDNGQRQELREQAVQTNQIQNDFIAQTDHEVQQESAIDSWISSDSDESCQMSTEDSYYKFSSEENDNIIDLNLAKNLEENQKFLSLLTKIDAQKINFLETFHELYSDPQTKKIAITIVQYVQFKASLLISDEYTS